VSVWLTRIRRVGVFALFQGVTQVTSLAVGLIVVRLLSVEDYAIYALFGALAGAAAVTTDLGSNGAMITLTSRAKDPEYRRQVERQVAGLRSALMLFSIVGFCAVFLVMEREGGQHLYYVDVLLGIVIFVQANAQFYRARLASATRLDVINRADPLGAIFRLALLGGVWLSVGQSDVLLPALAWALSATGIAIWLWRSAGPVRSWPPVWPDPSLRKVILPLLPGYLYYILAGLLPVLSLGVLATGNNVAEFWALGRLGAMAAILTPVINMVGHPFVSRGHDEGFLHRSALVMGVLVAIVLVSVASGLVFPDIWLLLLGESYSGLTDYVWLALLVSGMSLVSGSLYQMVVASGETGRQFVVVAVGLTVQMAILYLRPIQDLDSAYFFSVSTGAVQLSVQFLLYLRSVRIMRKRIS